MAYNSRLTIKAVRLRRQDQQCMLIAGLDLKQIYQP
jgi:hypothetical protein